VRRSCIAGLEPAWKSAVARVAKSSVGKMQQCDWNDVNGAMLSNCLRIFACLHQSGDGADVGVRDCRASTPALKPRFADMERRANMLS
jgi:hypothetical protein